MINVANPELHQVTAAKVAINAEVEQRKTPRAGLYLKPDAEGADVVNL